MSYQRFESQKIVGRYYPWATYEKVQQHRKRFHRIRSYIDEIKQNRKEAINNIKNFPENDKLIEKFHSQNFKSENTENSFTKFHSLLPSTSNTIKENLLKNQNNSDNCENEKLNKTLDFDKNNDVLVYLNVTDDEKLNGSQQRKKLHYNNENNIIDQLDGKILSNEQQKNKRTIEKKYDFEDLDRIEKIEEISLDSTSLTEEKHIKNIEVMDFDNVPDISPPPPPPQLALNQDNKEFEQITSNKKQRNSLNATLQRLSVFKDMLILGTEISIKDHVPRPPQVLIKHALNAEEWNSNWKNQIQNDNQQFKGLGDKSHHHQKNKIPTIGENDLILCDNNYNSNKIVLNDNKLAQPDEIDFLFPTRKQIYTGIEQDDFIAKSVSFFGWILFIFMRMISLSVFSVFYPWKFLYFIIIHYGFMLICLIYESKLHEKIQRLIFYAFLAYIYIFVILEFRIKFKHLKLWYIGYFTIIMLENFILTFVWYLNADFESWWFDYLFQAIIISGFFNIACMLVYYFLLRPKDIILVEI